MKGIFLTSLVSTVMGLFPMVPLAMLFDAMNWPLFHSWGLAHGSFLIAWPVLTFITFSAVQIATLKKRPAVRDTLAAFSVGFVAVVLIGAVVAVAVTITFKGLLPMAAGESAMSHFTTALLVFAFSFIAILSMAFAITFRWTIRYLDSSK